MPSIPTTSLKGSRIYNLSMTLLAVLKEITTLFGKNGIDYPAKEAEILLTEALRITSSTLYAGDRLLSAGEVGQVRSFAARRARGEPLQYIVGHVAFCGLRINVGPGVLVPRPETELLVQEVIRFLREKHPHTSPPYQGGDVWVSILDLCTGSGCIALALAKNFPKSDVYGVDTSEAAMVYATQNAIGEGISNIHFKLGDLFGPIHGMTFDCIICNPPYIRAGEIATLQREVRDYEPREALDGGKDGLDFYRRIVKEAPRYLKQGGILALELGYDQAEAVQKMALDAGFGGIRLLEDYAGIQRILLAYSGAR
jgi:release factor glutamine methyltransferase